jgi:hypothetical protein
MAIVINGDTGITATGGADLIQDGSITESDLAFTVSAFPAGTVMLFAQTSAPTGWTKDTTNYNNSGLRVVTGSASTGGSVDFTTAFVSQTPAGSISVNTGGLSAGATTLTTAQIPSHTHGVGLSDTNGDNTFPRSANGGINRTFTSNSTGGGGSHSHSISGSATATFTGTAINLAVKYVDVIRATKD